MRVILVLTTVRACGTAVAGPPASGASLHPYLTAVKGARHLKLYCVGHGSPIVLYESALAVSTAAWRLGQGSGTDIHRLIARPGAHFR
jgi:hypothetical protein